MCELHAGYTGDDGTSTEVGQSSGTGLMKEAENIYALWCTGRTYCDGMLVTLKLLKRQDLVSSIARLLRPIYDQIVRCFVVSHSQENPLVGWVKVSKPTQRRHGLKK